MNDTLKTEQEQIQEHLDDLNNRVVIVTTSKYTFTTYNYSNINPYTLIDLIKVKGKWIKP